MKKLYQLIIHTFPLAVGIIASYFFWRSNFALLAIFLILTALIIFWGSDKRHEFFILIYGMGVGFVIEIIGTQVSGYQSFTNPNIIGIPYWLIVSWGYGFVLMKRIGLIMATGSPWIKK